MRNDSALLPHEALFGLFLLATWVRLSLVEGPTGAEALFYAGLLLGDAWLISRCRRRPTDGAWRLRLLFHPIAMNLVFMHMPRVVAALHGRLHDGALQAADLSLFGIDPCVWLQACVHPTLTDFFSLCYMFFFPYLAFSMVSSLLGDLETLKRFSAGLFTVYAIGFLGYSLLPAAGPHLAMSAAFDVPLVGGWLTRANAWLVARGSNGVDAFPSLHCGVSAYILLFDRRFRPSRFRACLLPCAGLWVSTIYLRYHYAIDVIAGFSLSAAALWVARRSLLDRRAPAAAGALSEVLVR